MRDDTKQKDLEHLIRQIIENVGEDINRSGLHDTPKRVSKSYREIFSGYEIDVEELCKKQFDVGVDSNDYVWLRGIDFHSVCEHHMLPIVGTADICYAPRDKIIGISKLARLVDVFSKRMQVQERMTAQIADTIQKYLSPHGVAVRVRAEHYCISMRGIKKPNCSMETVYTTGVFKEDGMHRREFFQLL